MKVSKNKAGHFLGMLAVVATGLWASMAPAQETSTPGQPIFNIFSLSSEASSEVENDLMTATLVVRAEDKDAALLANKVNASMGWAINKLRPFSTLNKKTRDYQTYPRYDSSQARRLIGWRATQTLQIETDDFEAAGEAIQLLQERLQVQGMRLSAKPETRKRALDALINEALNAFKQRARLVQRNMGSTGFRIIDLNIQTDRAVGPSYRDGVATAEIMRSAVVSEPAIEAGTSRVSVQVYGRIHLD